tara:strand:+ start:1744 stop:2520 length:777 start_codon:yes stop_codon:yes gene_type:complete
MAIAATTIFAGVSAAASVGTSVAGAVSAGKRQRRANRKARTLEKKLESLEASRQQVINPFEDVTSLSNMIYDTSDELSNPFNSLGVATQAAEFQAEEADIALANTLDALRASGASAGGATALAQAALQSKRGVSSSIELQEAQNQKFRADGEASLQSARQQEAIRVQAAQYGEAGRLQQADVAGKEFVYRETERRESEQLDRVQAQLTGQKQAAAQYEAKKAGYISQGIGQVGNLVGAVSNIADGWDAGSKGSVGDGG